MKRTISGLILSLFVAAYAEASASQAQSAIQGTPASQAPVAAPAPKTIVNLVRDAIAENDFRKAEQLARADMKALGRTPLAIEAFSWLGRGALAKKQYDVAMTYASRTYEMVEEQLKTRQLDDEAHLPIALGAAIEVQAHSLAGQGRRSEGLMLLQREIDHFKGTSITTRLYKNVNLLSLEGQPALSWASSEWLGLKPPTAEELKGKPVVIFLWAHWCGDCKKQGPILEGLLNKYKDSGITVIAPTQRFGYVEKKKPAGAAEELAYIEQIRDQYYPWMKSISAPVSNDVYDKYGVSTTPTYVMIDRNGNVSTYLPGQPTVEELEPLIQKIIAPATTNQR